MKQYPLNESHIVPEAPRYQGSMIITDDFYHTISKLTLEQHIQRAKSFLAGAYCCGNLHEEKPTDDFHDEGLSSFFFNEYQDILNGLKEGSSATSCEDYILQSLSPVFQSIALRTCFSRAMTWALCADLFSQAGLKDNAWSTLLEYKKSELSTEMTLEEEYNLSISNRNKALGSLSYKDFKHLKIYLIELLKTHAPKNGWKAAKNAASTLAPIVLDWHMGSSHSSRFHLSPEQVEKKLLNWINSDEQCKKTYRAFSGKKMRSKK